MIATRQYIPAYQFENIVFVPHYQLQGFYARPGGGMMSEAQLVSAGATTIILSLWERPYI